MKRAALLNKFSKDEFDRPFRDLTYSEQSLIVEKVDTWISECEW
jgi:hypothetical protein